MTSALRSYGDEVSLLNTNDDSPDRLSYFPLCRWNNYIGVPIPAFFALETTVAAVAPVRRQPRSGELVADSPNSLRARECVVLLSLHRGHGAGTAPGGALHFS